jgi:hypothetical protein
MKPAAILIVQVGFLAAERLRLLRAEAGYDVVGVAGRTSEAGRAGRARIVPSWRSSI